jgi:hypothetical protein
MHNLLSRSQMDGWNYEDELDSKLNDYYECLIECDSLNQHECKRICKTVLT